MGGAPGTIVSCIVSLHSALGYYYVPFTNSKGDYKKNQNLPRCPQTIPRVFLLNKGLWTGQGLVCLPCGHPQDQKFKVILSSTLSWRAVWVTCDLAGQSSTVSTIGRITSWKSRSLVWDPHSLEVISDLLSVCGGPVRCKNLERSHTPGWLIVRRRPQTFSSVSTLQRPSTDSCLATITPFLSPLHPHWYFLLRRIVS